MTIESGALVIAGISTFFSLIWVKIDHVAFRWILVLLSPLIIAYCFYWSPVWFSQGSLSEYSAWAPLFIGVWYVIGLSANIITTLFLLRKKRK